MWYRNYHSLPQDKSEEYLNDAERWDPSMILLFFVYSCPNNTRPVVRSNGAKARAKTLLHFIWFYNRQRRPPGFRHTRFVQFPAKLKTPSTYINFDLLRRNRTKTSTQFSPIQGLPCACASVHSGRIRPRLSAVARVISGAG